MYPEHNQMDPDNPLCSEESAYLANPDSEYGWEKLFSERLYLSYKRCYGMDIKVARYHNIFGPLGTWDVVEKSSCCIMQKIAQAKDGGTIDMWGDGLQTRSFLYVDECVEGSLRLMRSNWEGPVNIGSEEMVINQLEALDNYEYCKKYLKINHIPGPLGVRGRNSDNKLIKEKLDWEPSQSLKDGLIPTYQWISNQLMSNFNMKIIIVSGGFDPIHSGHISYFKSAREHGDKLVVALNSDEWLEQVLAKPLCHLMKERKLLKNIFVLMRL